MNALFSLPFHLKLAGFALLALAFAHLFFEKRFGWKDELMRLSPFNRQMFYVHNFFVTLVLVMIGALSLFGTNALLEKSALGLYVTGGISFFWLCRWLVQFFFYESKLWRGKKFETAAHIAFALFWSYLLVVYGSALWHQIS
ncbi:MAG TPA: hypothetical protein VGB77_10495 [Abditibacteriaceae bacterium]|jgi:hypothetical protein